MLEPSFPHPSPPWAQELVCPRGLDTPHGAFGRSGLSRLLCGAPRHSPELCFLILKNLLQSAFVEGSTAAHAAHSPGGEFLNGPLRHGTASFHHPHETPGGKRRRGAPQLSPRTPSPRVASLRGDGAGRAGAAPRQRSPGSEHRARPCPPVTGATAFGPGSFTQRGSGSPAPPQRRQRALSPVGFFRRSRPRGVAHTSLSTITSRPPASAHRLAALAPGCPSGRRRVLGATRSDTQPPSGSAQALCLPIALWEAARRVHAT